MGYSTELMRSSFYLMSARVITLALSFFYTVVLARYLKVDDFGKLIVILTFLSFFSLVTDFGLNRFIILKVSRKSELTEKFGIHMIFLRILLSLLAFGLMLAVIRLMGYSHEIFGLVGIAGLMLMPSSISLTIDALFQAKERMGISAAWQVLSHSLTTCSGLLAIYLGLRLKGILVFLLMASFFNLFIYIAFSLRAGWIIRSHIDLHFVKDSLRLAFPYTVITLLGFVYVKADTILLSLMETEKSVGLFGASYRIIEGLLVVPMVLMTACFPRMSRYSISDPHGFTHLYHSSLTLLSTLAFPIGILCTLFSEEIVRLVYGPQYAEASSAFSVLIWSLVLMYINAPAATILQTSDRFHRFIPFALINTLFNIVLNLILIPNYSIMGASIAKVISEITGLIILLAFTSKLLDLRLLPLFRACLPQVAAGGMMGLGILGMIPLHFHKWEMLLISSGIYGIVLLGYYHTTKREPLFKNFSVL